MSWADFARLLLLSAIWGGSFLFMRVAVPEMGPVFLIWFRVASASLVLAPILFKKRVRIELANNYGRLLLAGMFNAALPWLLLAYAVLSLEAGLTSLLNAATPISAALIGFFWLRHPLSKWQLMGLALGIVGVGVLAGERITSGSGSELKAVVAVLVATVCYGYSGHFSKRYLSDLSPWTVSLGSLLWITVILAGLLPWHWPDQSLSWAALCSALGLGILSTAIAFVLLFGLLLRAGATAVTTVTFIIPIFGILFGSVFLSEKVSLWMMIGMVIALSGAGFVTGFLPFRRAVNKRKA